MKVFSLWESTGERKPSMLNESGEGRKGREREREREQAREKEEGQGR